MTLKDVKSFFPRVHCKISTSKLRELFQEVDIRKRNELNFDEFVTLYNKLIYNSGVKIKFHKELFYNYLIPVFILLDFQ